MDLYIRNNTPEEFAQAVKYFQQALQLDPDFGAAAAALAFAYWDADEQRAAAMGLSGEAAYDKVFEVSGGSRQASFAILLSAHRRIARARA